MIEVKVKIQYLSKELLKEITSYAEALHKNRGYGVVTILVNGLTFGIPLRTRITHKNAFITDSVKRDNEICYRGLDYQKAVFIRDVDNDLKSSYKLEPEQRSTINNAEHKIKQEFTRYVKKYIRGVRGNNPRILMYYTFSTLQYYHTELGI